MVVDRSSPLIKALFDWIEREPSIRSAVLFGSHARSAFHAASADRWSDIDLHLIVDNPLKIQNIKWLAVLPGMSLILKVSRAATGGVIKLSLLFANGEADLVLVPTRKMQFSRLITSTGLQHKFPLIESSLNSFATVMSGGYKFIKGERQWAPFYARVVARMPGFRISDEQACRMAEDFLYEVFWIKKKLKRGEFIAAQRALHRSLIETNIILIHELRLRKGLTTFQQARRVEMLLSQPELQTISVSSKLNAEDLGQSLYVTLNGLNWLMSELVPQWSIAQNVSAILRTD